GALAIGAAAADFAALDRNVAAWAGQVGGRGLALVPIIPLRLGEMTTHPLGRRHVIALPRHHRAGPAVQPPIEIFVGDVERPPAEMRRQAQAAMPGAVAFLRRRLARRKAALA